MKQAMTYKIDYDGGSAAHYTHDKKEAYEVYENFKTDYGNYIRLYEAPMPINDHDEIEWETIEYFDAEDTNVPKYKIVLHGDNVYIKGQSGLISKVTDTRLVHDKNLIAELESLFN
jgi:hypothetical protein